MGFGIATPLSLSPIAVQHIATDITTDTTDNDNNLPIYMISFYVHLKLQYEQIPCLAIDD